MSVSIATDSHIITCNSSNRDTESVEKEVEGRFLPNYLDYPYFLLVIPLTDLKSPAIRRDETSRLFFPFEL